MKTGASLFAILFVFGFLAFAFNEFQFPKFLFGETKKTIAIIDKIDVHHAGKGVHYQKLYFSFSINDSRFYGTSNTGILRSPKSVGDTLVIEYESSNPQDYKVLGKKK
jgi:hypothetical protein